MSQKLQAAAWNGLCVNLVVVVAYWNHPVFAGGRSTAFLLLVVLVGLLCILEWLRETAWTLWAGVFVTLAIAATLLGIELSVFQIVLATISLGSLVRYIPGDDQITPVRSLVLLLREEQYVEGPMMARVASRAWNCEVNYESSDSTRNDGEDGSLIDGSPPFLIVEEAPFFCSNYPAVLTIHYFASPYFDEPEEVAADVREARVRTAILEHRAWLSCDLISWMDNDTDEVEADVLIGKLLAEFADDNCMAVVDLLDHSIYPFLEEGTEKALRSDSPRLALEELPYDPVITIAFDDPEMQAAVQIARDRWPEFAGAFEQRSEGQHFAMKARFQEGDAVEFMWVAVTAIEGDRILGVLDSDPTDIKSLQSGDRVQITIDDLNDWMFLCDGAEPVGGFTVAVLTKRQRGE